MGLVVDSYRFAAAAPSFVPTDIAGCVLWLDASDAATITGSPNVTQWDDKSTNAYAYTVPGGSTSPTTGVATLNGLNVLTHDATSERLNGTALGASSASTRFVVWNMTADSAFIAIATSNGGTYVGAAQSGSASAVNSSSGTPSLYVDGASFTGDRAALHTLMSGTATVFTAVNVVWAGAITLLTSYSGAGFESAGGLAEIIHYNSALGTSDREAVESYLATKWGL